jgi:O-antigen ligase
MIGYFLAGSTIGPVMSQSLLDFMIFLIFICFATQTIKSNFHNFTTLRKPYIFEYGFIFYFLSIVLGFFLLHVTGLESWLTLTRFNWIVNFYLFTWAFSNTEIDLKKMIKFFAWGFIIPNVYALVSFLYGYDFIHQQPLAYFRLVGILGSSTYHAHSNGIISIFFLTLLVFKFEDLNKFNKALSVLAASLMFLSVFLTFTRGVWISLFISVLCLVWLQNRKFFMAIIVAGAILVTTLYNTSESFRERRGQPTATAPSNSSLTDSPPTDTRSSDAFRINLLKLHWLIFKDSPLVGISYVNHLSHTPIETWEKYKFPSTYTINTHAHNQFMNTLTLTGFLGIIPFLLFYFWFFFTNLKLVKKFKAAKHTSHYILAVACLMAQLEFLIANMTDVGFEYSKIRSLILLVWALVFVLWTNKAKISETN